MAHEEDQYDDLRRRVALLKARIAVALLKGEDTFTPPDGVQTAAARGLELRAKWKRGGLSNGEASAQGIGSGVQRAVNLKNGDAISLSTVKRMHAFFSRHAKNYRPDENEPDGGPTAGTIAWLLWGGNAGKAWADRIVSRVEKARAVAPSSPILTMLQARAQAHNEAIADPCRTATVEALQEVWKRGAAMAPVNHPPQQAALGNIRVNLFLKALRGGTARSRNVADADLMPHGHPCAVRKDEPGAGDVHVPSTEWEQKPKPKKRARKAEPEEQR